MSRATAVAGAVQLAGGIALSPLVPGIVQTLKGRLQGRRGPSPLQPYRELHRLWGKTTVEPEGTTMLYRLAPATVAGATGLALLLLPIAGASPNWPLGNDALVLVGLLALARFAIALVSWDTGSGFALMGASRDLTFGVFVEGLFLLTLVVAALPGGSTDLLSLSESAAGSAIWADPAHWCAALAFGLVVIAETGRQPVDNPDTHLELTMVHEGPLLEYAGRDLAYLQWASAARHWIVLVLASELFLPHAGSFGLRLLTLVGCLLVLSAALALAETWQAKMRILRVPSLLAAGGALAFAGLLSWFIGGPA